MTERLDAASSNTPNTDCGASDLRVNYEYENENEKPILLELGATSSTPRNSSELGMVPYANNYPLDLHLNSAFSSVIPTLSHAYSIDPVLLFNNPYNNNRITTSISQTTPPHSTPPPSSLIARNSLPYPAHIPQTVYTWSTPNPVASKTQNDADKKFTTEIVPAPVYMTYSDTRELTISKRSNYLRKEKPLQTEKDYKRTACDRERTRMRDMNRAFDLLRSKLPISKPNGKKYSKIESLRIAINYINHLQKILEDNKADHLSLTAAKYLKELNVRRRSNLYNFENRRPNSFENTTDKSENLDESRSTWSDGYLANSRDKWE